MGIELVTGEELVGDALAEQYLNPKFDDDEKVFKQELEKTLVMMGLFLRGVAPRDMAALTDAQKNKIVAPIYKNIWTRWRKAIQSYDATRPRPMMTLAEADAILNLLAPQSTRFRF